MKNYKHEVIICIVNSGFSEAVMDAARELGANISWALSLPGKYAPESAGEIIAEGVLGILKEVAL